MGAQDLGKDTQIRDPQTYDTVNFELFVNNGAHIDSGSMRLQDTLGRKYKCAWEQ